MMCLVLKPKWFKHLNKIRTHFMFIHITLLLDSLFIISCCLSYNNMDCFEKEIEERNRFKVWIIYFLVHTEAD